MPTATQLLFWWRDTGWRILGTAILGFLALVILYRLIAGRARWQRLISTMPLFGGLWQATAVAEWPGLLNVLLKHEIPLPDALRLAGHGMRNAYIGGVSLAAGRRCGARPVAFAADVFVPCTSLLADSVGGVGRAIRDAQRVVSAWAGDVREACWDARWAHSVHHSAPVVHVGRLYGVVRGGRDVSPPGRSHSNVKLMVANTMNFGCASGLGTAGLDPGRFRPAVVRELDSPAEHGGRQFCPAGSDHAVRLGGTGRRRKHVGLRHGPVFSPLIWCVVLVVLIAGVVRYRRSEVSFLIWSLAEAAQRGIPLETVARAFANERGGRLAMRARNLADYLDAAMPLSLALSRSRMSVSPEIRLAADVGEKTGTLSQSLKKALQQVGDFERLLGSLFAKVSYLSVIFFVMFMILTFLMLKIVPIFEQMFREFGMQLPPMTLLLIAVSRWFVQYWFILLPVLLVLGFVAVLLLLSYLGISLRGLPIVGRFFSTIDNASVLQLLAVAVREKRPLVGSLELLAAYSRSHGRGTACTRRFARSRTGATGARHCNMPDSSPALSPRSSSRPNGLATWPGHWRRWPTARYVGLLTACRRH